VPTHGSERLSDAVQGRYVIERELGRGGMATVYLARDLKLQRLIALKVLRPELRATLGPERFLREIALTSQLSHPHILTLHDWGEANGRLFYAMPYVDGESLRQRLQREPQLPIDITLGIVQAVALALDYAHRTGVVHRDIKPENVLLARDPNGGPAHALVADFGIARALDAAGGERLTESGLALGTPAYMSPEQAAGSGALDGRSDLYALGCVAYEMLAGAPPFTGSTAQAILARHAVDPVPPLRTVRATVPEPVAYAIERALAKVPADRFASAGEFAQALTAPAATHRRQPRRRARVLWKLGGTVAGLAAVGTSAVLLLHWPPAVIPSAARIAVLPFTPLSEDTALVRLGRDLAATVSASLDRVGGIETADRLAIATETEGRRALSRADIVTLAHKLGASSVLRGTLVHAGDRVRLDLGLYEAGALDPVADGIIITGSRDSIGSLTDSISWALLRQVWLRGEPPSPSLAALTTRSLPALRAFLDGERALGSNQWEDARLAFSSAIAADSAFLLADFRYALAQWWQDQPIEPEIREALRLHRQNLPERERLLVEAFLTSADSTSLRIERHRLVAARFPNYWPAWFLYGDMLFHYGSERGHDWTEAVDAFRRAVALNPKLVPAWVHIHEATFGKDHAEAAQAAARLAEFGWPPPGDLLDSLLMGVDGARGSIPPESAHLADSLARLMGSAAGEARLQSGCLGLGVLLNGFPAAQLDLNQRALGIRSVSPQVRTALRAANAWAWAARGRWDSALTILDETARTHPGTVGPSRYASPAQPPIGAPSLAVENYGLAVIGFWLGATGPFLADERRSAAVLEVRRLDDEDSRRDARARLAWLDGILGFARGDRLAIRAAQMDAARTGYYQAGMVERSLAAFDQALMGDRRRAGRELAALDGECLEHAATCNLFTPHIAVHRLAAAQWLWESGDVEQARRLLRWQDAEGTYTPCALWTLVYTLGAPTYLARARLEEAGGDHRRAREYYQQFVRRYDQPIPSQVHLVEEANAALARLGEAAR
jgi:TolB-like protein/tetratricopeptide (TPR) repeat protein